MHVSSIIMRSKYPTSYLHFKKTLQKISKFKGIGEEIHFVGIKPSNMCRMQSRPFSLPIFCSKSIK